MMTETTSEAPKPPVKRSLFNKPAWARSQVISSPEHFFHRANAASIDPAAEIERKRKAKAARKEAEKDKAEKAPLEAEAKPADKRRRISQDEDDDLYGASDQEIRTKRPCEPNVPRRTADADRSTAETLLKQPSPKSLAKRYDNKMTAKVAEAIPKSSSIDIIDLDDSDEEEITKEEDRVPFANKPPPPPEDDDFPASDDEYAELARSAREKARRKRLEDEILTKSQKPLQSVVAGEQGLQSCSKHAQTPPSSACDPEVQILITSRLENQVSLIVKRKLSQRLKDVRLAWCAHNHFAPDLTNGVFLTWRGKRLFDVTTCKSLGITVDKDGRVQFKQQDDIFADQDRTIRMEAMTEEIYEEYQKAKRRAVEPDDMEEEEEQEATPQEPQEAQVRVILKARGFADLKLIAKPTTPIARMLAAFRKGNPAATENKEVYIVFDGERLEAETMVGDTELNDLDELDVYIK